MEIGEPISEAHRRVLQYILRLPNVNGCNLSYADKIRDGKETGVICLQVFVREKIPSFAISGYDSVPSFVGEMLTDVVEVGEFSIPDYPEYSTDPHKGRADTLVGGVSVGHYLVTAGTLGAVFEDTKHDNAPVALSNVHVLYNRDNPGSGCSKVGDPILQPGPYDQGVLPKDRIGFADRFIPLEWEIAGSLADAALCALDGERSSIVGRMLNGDQLKGFRAPVAGETLHACMRNGELDVRVVGPSGIFAVSGYGCQANNLRTAWFDGQAWFSPSLGGGSSGTVLYSKQDFMAVILNHFGNGTMGQPGSIGGGGWMSRVAYLLDFALPGVTPPQPSCPPGFHFDPSTGKCLRDTPLPPPPNSAHLCPPSMEWNDDLKRCIKTG